MRNILLRAVRSRLRDLQHDKENGFPAEYFTQQVEFYRVIHRQILDGTAKHGARRLAAWWATEQGIISPEAFKTAVYQGDL